ncbi:hypothetical protein GW17_00025251 [Ensete ventricosum]|uniref:Uncharacterized protein n=1 Tax=Ensete ventricosum TaxID=4639 RepID=A0A426XHL1_ENSVE|nr:hypothetical protein B296_00032332 [Ensete ventricosum]RWW11160.1 hypothetical protein GW17_00025251 [Ensete ventricosum]RZS10073.1 hypothetical protein BHM03_00041229 [Ensete ventricosum]
MYLLTNCLWNRSPLVSFLYERGWRQNFVWGGFPGPEREFLICGNWWHFLLQYYIRASSNYLYLSEGELEDLCQTCGLVNFTCVRNGPFVMISATKPS